MKKGLALFLCLLLVVSMIVIPIPSGALDYGMDQDLGSVDASFRGEGVDNYSGFAIALDGDVDGDGYDDILVGAYGNDEGGTDAGQTYIIFGKASGWAMDRLLRNSGASFWGERSSSHTGKAVAFAGDINDDGYDDILIGASSDDEGGTNSGQTYIVLGKASGWAMDSNVSNANASFRGENEHDSSGAAVAGAGDVNGDGYEDFLIGAYNNDEGGDNSGQTYLIFGKASGWAMDTALSAVDASFWGEAVQDYSGVSVAGAGDVNGDGYDDILIGAYFNNDAADNAGQAYLFFGKASGWAMDTNLSNANASFLGEYAYDTAGRTVTGAGDVNGDGYDDILIGAPTNDENGNAAGQIYLIFGKASGWTMDVNLSNADASFLGESASDQGGRSTTGAGDVNGDGFDDIVISVPYNDEGGSSAGQSYLVLGKASGWAMDIDLSDADASFLGEDTGDYSGVSVAGGGDVDRDGHDDILIGAHSDDDGGSKAGQTYLVFADENTNATAVDSVKAFSDSAYSLEISVASMNDMVYIELNGTDGDSDDMDTELVNVTSSTSDPAGFTLRLIETGNNTGKYRGNFTIKNRTKESKRWIGCVEGETVNISSVNNPLKYATVLVRNSITILPLNDNLTATEDMVYDEHYWTVCGPASAWVFESNASWLSWNVTSHNISGTPDNGDIGSYWVRINVTDGTGHYDEHNFTLTVVNVAPTITTSDITTATEDSPYSVTYACDDDPTTTWVASDNASWLNFNAGTRTLSGTPDNSDVGLYWVNVTVDDGNEGIDYTNFSLTVGNVLPIITVGNIETTPEDAPYQVNYDSTDDGAGNIIWSLDSNATFLSIVSGSGMLSGTPDNGDVGSFYVNVSVDDGNGGFDSTNFTLSVTNVAPLITTADLLLCIEDALYSVDYNSSEDGAGNVTWSLATDSDFLAIDQASGVLSGTPDNTDIGIFFVNVTVNDGNGAIASSNFTLTVTNVAPDITTLNDLTALEDELYEMDYQSTDDDQGTITWNLETNATWLVIDQSTGMLNGTPDNTMVGWYWVNISVNDGNDGSSSTNFTLTVENTLPEIVTMPASEVDEDSKYLEDFNSTDDGFGSMTWSINSGPSWLSMDPVTGIMNGTPTNEEVGSHTVIVWVDDGNGGIGTLQFSLQVKNTNDDPVITSLPNGTAEAYFEYSYDVNAFDVDVGDILEYTLGSEISGMSIDGRSGLIVWIPTMEQLGEKHVTVNVSDGTVSVTQEFIIHVAAPGSLPQGVTLISPENGSTIDVVNPELVWSVTGPESDMVVFDVYLSNIRDDVSNIIDHAKVADGVISTLYIPTTGLEKGLEYYWTIIPRIDDITGSCTSGVWTFFVKENATADLSPAALLKAPVNGTTITKMPVQLVWSGADPDSVVIYYDLYLGTELTKVAARDPTVMVSDDQTDEVYNATDLTRGMVYYWIVIPNDGINVGDCTSGVWWFKLDEAASVNHAPIISSSPVKDATIGEEYRYDVDATDEDGDKLQFSLTQRPQGMVIDAQTGLILWTPSEGQDGDHTIKVKVSDGALFVVQTFTIHVRLVDVVNNKPTITTIPDRTIKVGNDFIYQVAATDADAGDVLTYKLEGQPAGMDITSTGLISWIPAKDQVGEHTITVNISDGKDHAIAHFKITVEKKGTTPGDGGLDATMLGIIAVIIIAVVVALVAVVATRGRKKEVAEVEEEEEPEEPLEEPPEPPQEAPVEEEAEPEIPEEKPEAELEDEIDLDDLEDED